MCCGKNVCVCWWIGLDLYQNSFIFDTHTSLTTTNQKASIAIYILSQHRVQSINRWMNQWMNESIDRSIDRKISWSCVYLNPRPRDQSTNESMNEAMKQWINRCERASTANYIFVRPTSSIPKANKQKWILFLRRIKRRAWYVLLHYAGVHACNAMQCNAIHKTPKQGDFTHEYGKTNTSSERANQQMNKLPSWILFIYLSFFSSRRDTCCKTKHLRRFYLWSTLCNAMHCNAIKLDDYYWVQYKYGQKNNYGFLTYTHTHRDGSFAFFFSRGKREILLHHRHAFYDRCCYDIEPYVRMSSMTKSTTYTHLYGEYQQTMDPWHKRIAKPAL